MLTLPYGNNLKLYIDGGAHDEKIEMRLEGFPAGVKLDKLLLSSLIERRRARANGLSTKRLEGDEVIFNAGLIDGVTTGEPITAFVKNENTDSAAYINVKDTPRPSHADYAAMIKYGKDVDLRGGGHFSGRLTVLLCAAGALCESYLAERGIEVFAKIGSIGNIYDIPLNAVNPTGAKKLKEMPFAVFSPEQGEKMKELIRLAAESGDSVGGTVECAATGLPAGLGEHMFAGVEARISSAVFAVPGVKGIEFGSGFKGSEMNGSMNNDPFMTDGETVFTHSNNCGGILGGMTNGMPVIFRAAVKPTPTIAKKQRTVSLNEMKNVEVSFGGRHDPCIVPRATAAIEAAAAVALCDIMLDYGGEKTLEAFRTEIDKTDSEIVKLIKKRMGISGEIGKIKKAACLPVKDEKREKELFDRLRFLAEEDYSDLTVNIYKTILEESRNIQSRKRVFLLGRKLGHSLSAPIHKQLGDYRYELKELEPEELEGFIKSGDFDALNVTIPYKKAVIPFLDFLDETALKTGAVNTVVKTENGLKGYNTDAAGFAGALGFGGIDVKNKKVLVLGNGGASCAVQKALCDLGAGQITVVSRSGENNFENIAEHYDSEIIVNATPVGMFPENGKSLVDLARFGNCGAVIDLIYNPQKTALLMQAESLGIKAVNGLAMLVYQAAEGCALFGGEKADEEKIKRIIKNIEERYRNIVLVGMPGSGKSTVGRLLAEKLGREFVDTDEMIKQKNGLTSAAIIENSGEAAFREIEADVIAGAGKLSGAVIAAGGGAVTKKENYPALHQNGIIIELCRNIEELETAGRPLTAANGVEKLYAERRELYDEFADFKVKCADTPQETAARIIGITGGEQL